MHLTPVVSQTPSRAGPGTLLVETSSETPQTAWPRTGRSARRRAAWRLINL